MLKHYNQMNLCSIFRRGGRNIFEEKFKTLTTVFSFAEVYFYQAHFDSDSGTFKSPWAFSSSFDKSHVSPEE